MKKFLVLIAVFCCIFSFISCKNSHKNTAPLSTEKQQQGASLWYEKIHLKQLYEWSFSVIETDDSFYYYTSDGLYKYDKNTQNDIKILTDEIQGLFMYENTLYFNTSDEIKSLDLKTYNITKVWDKSMLPDTERQYIGICDFKIVDEYLYIQITGTSAIRVSLETKESEIFLSDFNCMVLSNSDCYYIEHASRSFSIYHMNCETKEPVLVRGEGYPEPDVDRIIDGIIKVENDIYYSVRGLSNIYKLNHGGEDELIVDGPDGPNTRLKFIYHSNDSNLYYTIQNFNYESQEGASYKLYRYNPLTKESLLISIDTEKVFYGIFAVTESAVFYKESEDSPVKCIELNER